MKIITDGIPETIFSPGVPAFKKLGPVIQKDIPGQFPPYIIGKALQVNSVWRKVILIGLPRHFSVGRPGLYCLQMIQTFHLGYKKTPARLRLDISFRQKLLIG